MKQVTHDVSQTASIARQCQLSDSNSSRFINGLPDCTQALKLWALDAQEKGFAFGIKPFSIEFKETLCIAFAEDHRDHEQ